MTASPDPTDLPLATHALVLGADIQVDQRATYTHEYRGHGDRADAVDVNPYDGTGPYRKAQRAYLAAWARRTIERPEVTPRP